MRAIYLRPIRLGTGLHNQIGQFDGADRTDVLAQGAVSAGLRINQRRFPVNDPKRRHRADGNTFPTAGTCFAVDLR